MSDFNYFEASIFIFLTPRPLMVRSPLDTIAGNDAAQLRFSRLRPVLGRRLRIAAELGVKSVKHHDKQTTLQNYIFPVHVRIRAPHAAQSRRDGTRHHPNLLYVVPLCMGLVISDW